MEEIGAAAPQDQAVKAVLSQMFITMASALVSVGHLCRKLIVEEGEKWVRFANKAYDLLKHSRRSRHVHRVFLGQGHHRRDWLRGAFVVFERK